MKTAVFSFWKAREECGLHPFVVTQSRLFPNCITMKWKDFNSVSPNLWALPLRAFESL